MESLCHGGIPNDAKVEIQGVHSEKLEQDIDIHPLFSNVDGILMPGGFGDRGVEGQVKAIRYARENGVPFFGICLGMQCMAIEFARSVCGLEGANSTEFVPDTPYPVIDLLPDQKQTEFIGGSMRLGHYPCFLAKGTKACAAYKELLIEERHRHRYEFNNSYREKLEKAGMVFSGVSPITGLSK